MPTTNTQLTGKTVKTNGYVQANKILNLTASLAVSLRKRSHATN